jgi:cell wall-associated NlpC family hydrolase
MSEITNYPWKSIALDGQKIIDLIAACRRENVPYKLGGKAPSLSAPPEKLKSGIDCSGFVRWAVWQASPSDKRVVMPDGSWHQGEWAAKQGFKVSSSESCLLKDGRIRLAYWLNAKGISHIALVLNGKTLESHGGKGPNSRAWSLKTTWMRAAKVWALDAETNDMEVA